MKIIFFLLVLFKIKTIKKFFFNLYLSSANVIQIIYIENISSPWNLFYFHHSKRFSKIWVTDENRDN